MPRVGIRIGSGLLAVAAFSACHKEAPSGEAPKALESAASGSEAPARASEFHEPTFDITVKAQDRYSVGAESSFYVVVVPKGGYHTNDKYPYTLKLQATDGVKFPADVVTRDSVTLEPMKASMKVSLVPTAKGPKEVGGQLSFSLCSPERCLVEKRDVVTTLQVD